MLPVGLCYSHDVAEIRAKDFLKAIVGMNHHFRKTFFSSDNGRVVRVFFWSQQPVGLVYYAQVRLKCGRSIMT
jgi:hypothetical protein